MFAVRISFASHITKGDSVYMCVYTYWTVVDVTWQKLVRKKERKKKMKRDGK
jgi:heme/copper-type cytochrome/quinol oxidase subunit 3